ncbi:MAG: GlsB/YeaQ/YmgE family stress response membrane protein [Melioribacteraceae bacterium]|nr:GlsB/YeaQ/YmgE family stress response membrane protein [Melioribacteraceae bacterium]
MPHMGILGWILFGAIAGWLATLLSGTNKKKGCIFNIAIGIVGSFIGGFVFEFFGGSGISGFNIYSIFVATIGAMIFIWLIRSIRKDD